MTGLLTTTFLYGIGWGTLLLSFGFCIAFTLLGLTRCRSWRLHRAAWLTVLLLGVTAFLPSPLGKTVEIPVLPEMVPVQRMIPDEMPTSNTVSDIPTEIFSREIASSVISNEAQRSEKSHPVQETQVELPREDSIVYETGADPGSAAKRDFSLQDVFTGVFFVWLGGLLVLPVRTIFRTIRFQRHLRETEPACPEWFTAWQTLQAERNVRRPLPMLVAENPAVGPALVWRPSGFVLVVPLEGWDKLSETERESVMRHELEHFLRNDIFKSLFARFLALPHWFNPLAWQSVHRFEDAAEWACDEAATQNSPETLSDFARALVSLHETASTRPTVHSADAALQHNIFGRNISRRVARLLTFDAQQKKESAMKKVFLIAACLLLLASATVQVKLVAKNPEVETPPETTTETTPVPETTVKEETNRQETTSSEDEAVEDVEDLYQHIKHAAPRPLEATTRNWYYRKRAELEKYVADLEPGQEKEPKHAKRIEAMTQARDKVHQYWKDAHARYQKEQKEKQKQVETKNDPDELIWEKLGIRYTPVPKERWKETAEVFSVQYPLGGVTVDDVRAGSEFAKNGVRPGDVIVGIGKWATTSRNDLQYIAKWWHQNRYRPENEHVQVLLFRDGQKYYTDVPVNYVPSGDTTEHVPPPTSEPPKFDAKQDARRLPTSDPEGSAVEKGLHWIFEEQAKRSKELSETPQPIKADKKPPVDPAEERENLFEQGKAAYEAERYDDAKPILEKFVEKFPQHDQLQYVLFYLGDIALKNDNLDEAQHYFTQSVKMYPKGERFEQSVEGLAAAVKNMKRVVRLKEKPPQPARDPDYVKLLEKRVAVAKERMIHAASVFQSGGVGGTAVKMYESQIKYENARAALYRYLGDRKQLIDALRRKSKIAGTKRNAINAAYQSGTVTASEAAEADLELAEAEYELKQAEKATGLSQSPWLEMTSTSETRQLKINHAKTAFEVAQAELTLLEETNRRHPGAISDTEIEKAKRKVVEQGITLKSLQAPNNEPETVSPDSEKTAGTQSPARKELTFQGKTFEQWGEELKTELDPKMRAEAFRALAMFGANGKGREATETIVDAVKGVNFNLSSSDPQLENMKLAATIAFADNVIRIPFKDSMPILMKNFLEGNVNEQSFAQTALSNIGHGRPEPEAAEFFYQTLAKADSDTLKDTDRGRYLLIRMGICDLEGVFMLRFIKEAIESKDESRFTLAFSTFSTEGRHRNSWPFGLYPRVAYDSRVSGDRGVMDATAKALSPYGEKLLKLLQEKGVKSENETIRETSEKVVEALETVDP